jgi:hypothetical protein
VKDNPAHWESDVVLQVWGSPSLGWSDQRRIMSETDSLTVRTQLDEHHTPETNGRIPVCRRCGCRTDGPEGLHHLVPDSQVTRSSEWLVAQSRLRDIESARTQRAK